MKAQDPYQELAKSYDMFGDIITNQDKQDFFQSIFSNYGVKHF